MSISHHGTTTQPAYNGSYSTSPGVIAPPANCVAGDLVLVTIYNRVTNATIAVSNAGGQTWTKLSQSDANALGASMTMFWCIFDGTWDASPSFSHGGTNATLIMSVFRSSISGTFEKEAEDTDWPYQDPLNEGGGNHCVIGGDSTISANSVTIAVAGTIDDNNLAMRSGYDGGYTAAASIDNLAGSDSSVWVGYKINSASGTEATVHVTQVDVSPDKYVHGMVTFKEVASGPETHTAAITEAATATDSATCPKTASASIAETITATDTPNFVSPVYDVSITEAATAAETITATVTQTHSASISEGPAADYAQAETTNDSVGTFWTPKVAFTIPAGSYKKMQLYIGADTAPSGTLFIEVFAKSGDLPTGSALYSAFAQNFHSYEWKEIPFNFTVTNDHIIVATHEVLTEAEGIYIGFANASGSFRTWDGFEWLTATTGTVALRLSSGIVDFSELIYGNFVTEAATATDSSPASAIRPAADTEAVTATEFVDGTRVIPTESLTEAVTATDASSEEAQKNASTTEAPTAGDTESAVTTFLGQTSEPLTATDAPTQLLTANASIAEAVTGSDAPSALASLGASITESAPVTDTANAIFGGESTVTEAVTASEVVSGTRVIPTESLTETASLTDSPSAALEETPEIYNVDITETATAVEALDRLNTTVASITEGVESSDSLNALRDANSAIIEAITLEDNIDGIRITLAETSESASLDESIDRNIIAISSFTEALTLEDLIDGIVNTDRDLTETASPFDASNGVVVVLADASITETANLTAQVNGIIHKDVSVEENLSLIDSGTVQSSIFGTLRYWNGATWVKQQVVGVARVWHSGYWRELDTT